MIYQLSGIHFVNKPSVITGNDISFGKTF